MNYFFIVQTFDLLGQILEKTNAPVKFATFIL